MFNNASREMYLNLVLRENVATEEEAAEYRAIHRATILAEWQKHVDKITLREKRREEEHTKSLLYHAKRAIQLRRLGLYDLAVKLEEYILLLERDEHLALGGHFKGFPDGWGDEECRCESSIANKVISDHDNKHQ